MAGALFAASQPGPLTSLDAQGSQGIAAVERRFAAPPDEARIMMRWWWFGPSITRAEIESEMQRMKDGGIGGFEIATVYPMAVDDPARGIRNSHSWTEQAASRFFSGTATYRRRIEAPAGFRAAGSRVILDFGDAQPIAREAMADGSMRGNSFAALVQPPLREAAVVFVNQQRAGSLWAPPYRIDVTDYLKEGPNELSVEVYNTAINQLAEGGRLPDVSAVTERYGQRFRLQDMENLQPLPSGMLSIPRLVLER